MSVEGSLVRSGPRGGYVRAVALLACAILTGCQTPAAGGRSSASDQGSAGSVEGQHNRITAGHAIAADLDGSFGERISFGSTMPISKRSKVSKPRDGSNTIPPARDVGL